MLRDNVVGADDYHPPMPGRNPEDIRSRCDQDRPGVPDRAGVTRFRKEQALKPLYTMIGSAAIVIAWIELFWRHCLYGSCLISARIARREILDAGRIA